MKKTIYNDDTILIIINDNFHDYPIGTKVKVLNSDDSSYHVVNITNGEKRWWWVKHNQVKEEE